jgi:FtsP/CotA-like multicopper oxidase with cupredoxin domain
VTTIDLAPAERVDLLLDLRTAKVGDAVMLQSQAFTSPGAMGFMGGANLQGQAMDLLEFRVTKQVRDTTRIPTRLPAIGPDFALPDPAQAQHTRTFRFNSRMMDHMINDKLFAMERVDETVPFGRTEIWRFVNESNFTHPVHLHATHFRVVSRTGGRGVLMPWEAGRKDTVLIWPNETVEVAVRFTAQRGLFLLHCHNLEHEDMGMMANILVE